MHPEILKLFRLGLWSATLSQAVVLDASTISCDAGLRGPTVRLVPLEKLFVSEPDPNWFGNQDNEQSNPVWTNDNWLKSRFHFSFAE